MYRKAKSNDCVEPMPKKQFRRIVKAFNNNGGSIIMSEETDKHLKGLKAEGSTLNAITIKRKSCRHKYCRICWTCIAWTCWWGSGSCYRFPGFCAQIRRLFICDRVWRQQISGIQCGTFLFEWGSKGIYCQSGSNRC